MVVWGAAGSQEITDISVVMIISIHGKYATLCVCVCIDVCVCVNSHMHTLYYILGTIFMYYVHIIYKHAYNNKYTTWNHSLYFSLLWHILMAH